MDDTTRYAVVDVPTSGPNKGKITKVWDFDLHYSDAELLKKRIANRRFSKWPVALSQDGIKERPRLDDDKIGEPTAHECEELGIDPQKFAGMTPEQQAELEKGLSEDLGHALDPLFCRCGTLGTDPPQVDASACPIKVPHKPCALALDGSHEPAPPPTPNDPAEVCIAPGYDGNPLTWCFWEREYPEEMLIGGFDSEEACRAGVHDFYANPTGKGNPFGAGSTEYKIVRVLTEEQFRSIYKLEPKAPLPPVTKNENGHYTVGPPPDGRSVNEHLDELAKPSTLRAVEGVDINTGDLITRPLTDDEIADREMEHRDPLPRHES